MATTEVRISLQGDLFVPSVSSVSIVPGDSVTFFADPDLATNLNMTGETAAILSPQPGLTVTIPAGYWKTFEFSAAAPGLYCILTQSAECSYPNTISCGSDGTSTVLSIKPGPSQSFSGPDDDTKT
jgi:hypothetical protein